MSFLSSMDVNRIINHRIYLGKRSYIISKANNSQELAVSLYNESNNTYLRHTSGKMIESKYPSDTEDKYFYDDSSFVPCRTSLNNYKFQCTNPHFEKYYIAYDLNKDVWVISSKNHQNFFIYNRLACGDLVLIDNKQFEVVKLEDTGNVGFSFKLKGADLYLFYDDKSASIETKHYNLNDAKQYIFDIQSDNYGPYFSPIISKEILSNDSLKKRFSVNFVKSEIALNNDINDTLLINNLLMYKLQEQLDSLETKFERFLSIFLYNFPVVTVPKATGVLRSFQVDGSNLLQLFDRVCRNNHINYWLRAGTLLGAFRHKGFIPWDDDIDVGMMFEDFVKLKDVLTGKLSDIIDLYEFEPYSYKICIKGRQAWIDIYVFYYKKAEEEISIHQMSFNNLKKICRDFLQSNGVNHEYRSLVVRSTLEISSESKTDIIFKGIENYEKNYLFFKTDQVFPLVELEFEGHLYFVPNDYYKMLINEYGDIFQYPTTLKTNHKLPF